MRTSGYFYVMIQSAWACQDRMQLTWLSVNLSTKIAAGPKGTSRLILVEKTTTFMLLKMLLLMHLVPEVSEAGDGANTREPSRECVFLEAESGLKRLSSSNSSAALSSNDPIWGTHTCLSDFSTKCQMQYAL